MANKFKKEKYIMQSQTNKGWKFRVKIRLSDSIIDKTFHEKDYLSVREAYDKAKKYRDSVLANPVSHITTTIRSVAQCFEESFTYYPLRIETIRKQRLIFNKYIPYHDMPISKVTVSDIQLSLNNMIETSSNDVIQRVMSIWRRIYQVALLNDYANKDLTLKVIVPKSHLRHSKRDFKVTKETLDTIINHLLNSKRANKFDNYILVCALQILYYTGMRPCECFALEKKDINLSLGTISINKEIGSNLQENNVIRQCKTEQSIRQIPITNELFAILKELIEKQPNDILLADHNVKYLNSTNVGNKLRLICKQHGIKFNMYQLRHQFSTDLITNNVDIRTVMELMGHNNTDMTIDYARSSDKLKKEALDNRN